jgi:hypothetical protein
MKVGMQKVNDNEWLVQLGPAILRLDRFSTHLFHISIKQALSLQSKQPYSILASYLDMTKKLKYLAPVDWSVVYDAIDKQDLRVWLSLLKDESVKEIALKNAGSFTRQQLIEDLQSITLPPEAECKVIIRRFVETIYALEDQGLIEFYYPATAYL